jgi:thiol:disulfide interchange protein DsbD
MFSELQIYIESQVSGSAFHPFLFFLLILGGFLASLLPCVYPLYPITAGILKSRTDKIKWLHPVIYYIGLASMYLVFGVVAGFTGGIFNTILRYPETNLVLAYILFVLGLSSAEFLHLPIFGQKTANTSSVSLSGSFFLGMGAGLLSSPCVGPVVVSILLQVISTSAPLSLYSILSTAFKMFAFGLGVGLPFLAIGVFGLSLPRSGKWMRYVQYILSLLILYFSYSYLTKAGDSWGWSEFTSLKLFILWILLLLCSYFLQVHTDFIAIRMKKALSLTTMILIAICMILTVSSNHSLQDTNQSSEVQSEVSGNLTWFKDRETVFQKAKSEKKYVFIDFYADWCTNCKEFQKLTLKNENLNNALLNHAILWKIEDTDEIFETFVNDERFPELKIGLPFFIIMNEKGNLLYKTNNYLAIEEMILALKSKN